MSLPLKLIQRIYDGFQQTPSGDVAFRTTSVTPNPTFGQTSIAVTGTAVQLPAGSLTNGVILQAKSTNTANLTIGGSGVTNTTNGTGNGFILEPGNSLTFACDNTNDLYVNGTAGDIVSWGGS